MKFIIATLTFISLSASASTTRELLRYDFGNQITRSSLTVLSNGLVMKSEVLHGKRTYLADSQLSQEEVDELVKNIDTASLAAFVRNDEVEASMGGSYGEANIFTSDGRTSILYAMVGGDNHETFKKTMVCQIGAPADLVREFIQLNVRDRMPLTETPCK